MADYYRCSIETVDQSQCPIPKFVYRFIVFLFLVHQFGFTTLLDRHVSKCFILQCYRGLNFQIALFYNTFDSSCFQMFCFTIPSWSQASKCFVLQHFWAVMFPNVLFYSTFAADHMHNGKQIVALHYFRCESNTQWNKVLRFTPLLC